MSDPVVIALIVSIAPTIMGIATFIQTVKTHKIVNSRMTELLELTRSASLAEGKESERTSGKDKAP